MVGLKRELGLFEATVYGIGIILGAGIYALIGEAAGLTGNSLWLSFAIGAVVATFTGLSYAELSTIFPKAAAEYVYVSKGLNSKVLAFLIGWLVIFTGMSTVVTVSLGFAGYFNGLFGSPISLIAVALIIILSYVSFVGIKESSQLNVLFTFVEMFGLVLIIFLGFSNFGNAMNVNYFEMHNGVKGVLVASALVFFAYLGFEHIANISEETRNPRRTLWKAFMLAIAVTTILYVLTSIAVVNLADSAELSNSKSPLALVASKTFLGDRAFTILSYIALFATSNTVLVAMIVGARMIYGMSRSGSLPRFLSQVHRIRRTPHIAILLFMIFSLLFLFVGGINFMANMTSLGAFITFALVNASLIWLRFRRPEMKRPFKSPVNIGKFPVLAFLGLVTSGFMIFQFEPEVILFTIAVIAFGLVLYQLFERKIIR